MLKSRQGVIYNKCHSARTVFFLRCPECNKSFYSALRIRHPVLMHAQINQQTVRIVQIFHDMLHVARFAQRKIQTENIVVINCPAVCLLLFQILNKASDRYMFHGHNKKRKSKKKQLQKIDKRQIICKCREPFQT